MNTKNPPKSLNNYFNIYIVKGEADGKNETWARVTFHRAKLMLQKSLKEMKI